MKKNINPLVSILIPTFNSSRFISETINSVLAQTYKPLEIVVVDDGSSDNTIDILESYTSSGIKIYNQANSGAAKARNKAFDLSNGEYILYLDADDLICPEHIENLMFSLMGQKSDAIAFSQWDRFYSNYREASFPNRPTNKNQSGIEWLLSDWESVNMQQCGMFMIPRTHIINLGGWVPKLSKGPIDDFEFFARTISASSMMVFAPKAKLFYRSGLPGSLSRRNSRIAIEAKLESLKLGTTHLLEKFNTHRARLACANKFQNFIYETYPEHIDLIKEAEQIVRKIAKPTIKPIGPPGFIFLKGLIGWRYAKKVQRWATRVGLNRASLIRKSKNNQTTVQ